MKNKATLPYARIPRELLWTDILSPLAIKILMWAQTLNKDEGSYKNATKRKLMSLWQNYKPRNGFTDALKELERVGLLSRIHSRYNGNYCGCVYRFATYADIEKFCKRIKKGKAATKVNVTDEAEAEE